METNQNVFGVDTLSLGQASPVDWPNRSARPRSLS